MINTPQPPQQRPQKEQLRVRLTGREHGYYSNMFQKVDPREEGKVTGKEAVTFFKSSGLTKEKLKEIWMMASYTSQAFLTKEEFYVALRLIAYAQNNIECSEKSVKLNIEVALPTFNLGNPAGPAQPSGLGANEPPPAFKPEQINELPGLDELDPAMMDNINSLIPAVDQRMKMEQ